MDKRLVTEPYAYIRKEARESLKGNWITGTAAAMLFYVLTVFIRNILNLMVGNSVDIPLTIPNATGHFLTLTISGNLYDLLTTPIFAFGFAALCLVLIRERKVEFSLMLGGFSYYIKLLLLGIVMAVKIILWTCLFVIPGIVAALNYSQAYYIFFDDPSKGVFQCIHESIYLMRGNKANLFVLDLTFIGWLILGALATNVVMLPLETLMMGDYFNQVYTMIAYIPTAIVLIYFEVTNAKFHDLLYLSKNEGVRRVDPITGEYYVEPESVTVEENVEDTNDNEN